MMITKQTKTILVYLLYAWIVFGAYQIGKMIGAWPVYEKCRSGE